jgi:hypothetical protein
MIYPHGVKKCTQHGIFSPLTMIPTLHNPLSIKFDYARKRRTAQVVAWNVIMNRRSILDQPLVVVY